MAVRLGKRSFQSTRPVRGATSSFSTSAFGSPYFNPRAPCGARPRTALVGWPPSSFQSTRPVRGATKPSFPAPRPTMISIHAPRAGRDAAPPFGGSSGRISIHAPRAGRDPPVTACSGTLAISIHAPRAGRDFTGKQPYRSYWHFNPRAPCGARLHRPVRRASEQDFNPRAPCGARLLLPRKL